MPMQEAYRVVVGSHLVRRFVCKNGAGSQRRQLPTYAGIFFFWFPLLFVQLSRKSEIVSSLPKFDLLFLPAPFLSLPPSRDLNRALSSNKGCINPP